MHVRNSLYLIITYPSIFFKNLIINNVTSKFPNIKKKKKINIVGKTQREREKECRKKFAESVRKTAVRQIRITGRTEKRDYMQH